jgi:hypothetical protein
LYDQDALNYPYIRVRNVEWLKRTLLFFPHVVRMVPDHGAPRDEPDVEIFSRLEGRRGPLLRAARLHTGGVMKAQHSLIERIQEEIDTNPMFSAQFKRPSRGQTGGGTSLWTDRLDGHDFQLHRSKMLHELSHFLMAEGIAWWPHNSHGPGYVEMSVKLGTAVMSTLAFACAEDEGLELVTEFPQLYGRLIRQPKPQLFDAALGHLEETKESNTSAITDLFFYFHCDAQKMTPRAIQALNLESEALLDFKEALAKAAAAIPEIIASEPRRTERLNDALSDVLAKWQISRSYLSVASREMFGEKIVDAPQKFLEKLTEDVFRVGPVAGAIAGGIGGGTLTASAIGLAIGVVAHFGGEIAKARKQAKGSPLRYLSILEKHGAGFVLTQ